MKSIRTQLLLSFLLLALGLSARAQDLVSPTFGVFAGTGVNSSAKDSVASTQFGAQFAESVPNGYRGLLFEGGYIGPVSNLKAGSAEFSANWLANWTTGLSAKWLPFATGGYTRFCGTGNGVNFGAGIDYRYRDARAIRFEVRDYYDISGPRENGIAFRIGWQIYIPD